MLASIKAYDQNDHLEKEISLSKNSNWKTNETLYENMIYSNGTPIDYAMKLDSSSDYLYTISKNGTGYQVVATLKNQEGIVVPDDKNLTSKEESATVKNIHSISKEINPNTGDSITIYLFVVFLSFISFFLNLKLVQK